MKGSEMEKRKEENKGRREGEKERRRNSWCERKHGGVSGREDKGKWFAWFINRTSIFHL